MMQRMSSEEELFYSCFSSVWQQLLIHRSSSETPRLYFQSRDSLNVQSTSNVTVTYLLFGFVKVFNEVVRRLPDVFLYFRGQHSWGKEDEGRKDAEVTCFCPQLANKWVSYCAKECGVCGYVLLRLPRDPSTVRTPWEGEASSGGVPVHLPASSSPPGVTSWPMRTRSKLPSPTPFPSQRPHGNLPWGETSRYMIQLAWCGPKAQRSGDVIHCVTVNMMFIRMFMNKGQVDLKRSSTGQRRKWGHRTEQQNIYCRVPFRHQLFRVQYILYFSLCIMFHLRFIWFHMEKHCIRQIKKIDSWSRMMIGCFSLFFTGSLQTHRPAAADYFSASNDRSFWLKSFCISFGNKRVPDPRNSSNVFSLNYGKRFFFFFIWWLQRALVIWFIFHLFLMAPTGFVLQVHQKIWFVMTIIDFHSNSFWICTVYTFFKFHFNLTVLQYFNAHFIFRVLPTISDDLTPKVHESTTY